MKSKKRKQSIHNMIKECLDEAEKLKESLPQTEGPSWDRARMHT